MLLLKLVRSQLSMVTIRNELRCQLYSLVMVGGPRSYLFSPVHRAARSGCGDVDGTLKRKMVGVP
jgi:hypothetical protein